MAVRGDAEAVAELAAELVLSPADAEGVKFEAGLFTTASGLAEVIIPPRSTLIGERLFPGMVTPSGNLVVLAIHRQHHDLPPGEALEKGDTLLLQGTWDGARDLHRAARGAGGRQPRARPPPGGADGPRGADLARHHGGDGGAARHRPGAGGGRRHPRRRRDPRLRHPQRRGDLPRDQLDDGDPRRRDDAALDRDHRDRRGASSSPRGSSISSAASGRGRCSPGSSC